MHLIFDLDGTLVDSLTGITSALNHSLAEHGYEQLDTPTIRSYIGDGSWMLCKRALPDENDSVIDTIDAGFKKHYSEGWKTGTLIYDGILELLESLKGLGKYHLSILSNKPHAFTTEIITELFPAGTFDITLGQRDGIAKKPDPSGIREILSQSDHPEKTAYLIGDSTVDISTANNADIKSIAVTWGFNDLEQIKSVSPTHIVSDVASLTETIRGL